MPESRHTILMNAFRPAQEVDNPSFFAGRARQVAELTDALHVEGSTPLIYGDRGLGKTSLALQMMYIAEGAVQLLDALGLQDRGFIEGQQYHAFLITCTDATQNFDGLIQQLINAAEEVDLTSAQPDYKAKHLAEQSTSLALNFKIVQGTRTRKFIPEELQTSYQDFSPTEKLQVQVGTIVDAYRRPVLFIIDELDRLQDTRGLASFIKATSSKWVKFLLVGIASSFGSLLADHQSIARSLVAVKVPIMEELELRQIIDNAQGYLDDHDVRITFGYPAKREIVESATGFPWLVHVLGQSALQRADEAGRDEVIGLDVHNTIYDLPRNRFAQLFSDAYSKIVRDSPQREMVLRAFANWFADDIPTGEIYRILKYHLGIANPSAYKAELTKPEFGPVIYSPESRHRREVRFTDPIFKIYVRLTPSTFDDVDHRVRSAFQTL